MTKAELVAKLAEDTEMTQAQATKALNSLLSVLVDEIKTNGGIALSGLGSFSLVSRSERQGFNPKTKEPLVIPASKTVKFRVAKALKDTINS
ncbi:MAG: HU family DNA-binding protein [Deltaproteobacteria bacterium]|jgi:DNA-binding protein HU-beta|nr:HU family DNA-binding protein [Deltaproteobacteria bacterium]MDR1310147.1 HU family DNA-binding protein [Deltaproteobacteria bacterium]